MSSNRYQDLTANTNQHLISLRNGLPGVMQGFGELARSAMAPGVLDEKTKELIAMAIGVAVRCEDCLGFHGKALVRVGATEEEVREMLGVAVYMGGGPSLMYAAHALEAFEEFSRAAQAKTGQVER
ncbi:carboxymuconolactone decarboxylase family protein [Pseudoxanthomonas spadix]|jgi:AhpD family alkylhydroperoxidase|uniref:carboxymuconolactone decarboxylase family protein n=1 Tax=Pseudoxanthomonas spadix TaxID=415229 RepID=UPI000EFEF25B|nr:carboxymuconolactone decarboxylase family protein [Pseudoxanthomonas spadix]MBP3974147.1 carboxymuconolactone decarboxylase family protein [Pseudoxanthomonas spadix]RMW96352.1 carboxymuconolactone decarboxylase family protein [Pseudoxanthomonas spadix]